MVAAGLNIGTGFPADEDRFISRGESGTMSARHQYGAWAKTPVAWSRILLAERTFLKFLKVGNFFQ